MILYLTVGSTYTYAIEASDPNEDDDIMFFLPYDGLGATISESKYRIVHGRSRNLPHISTTNHASNNSSLTSFFIRSLDFKLSQCEKVKTTKEDKSD